VIGSGTTRTSWRPSAPDAWTGRARAAVWLRHTSGHMCVVNSLVRGIWAWMPWPPTCPAAGSPPTPTGAQRAARGAGPGAGRDAGLPVSAGPAHRRHQPSRRGIPRRRHHQLHRAGIGGGWVSHSPVELAAFTAAGKRQAPVRVELMVASEVLHQLARTPTTGWTWDWTSASGPVSAMTGSPRRHEDLHRRIAGRATAAMHDHMRGMRTTPAGPDAATCRPTRAVAGHDHRRAPLGWQSPPTRSGTGPSTWCSTRTPGLGRLPAA